jgi:phage-related protein
MGIWDDITSKASSWGQAVGDFGGTAISKIKDTFGIIVDGAGGTILDIKNTVSNAGGAVVSTIGGVYNDVMGPNGIIRGTIDTVGNIANDVSSNLALPLAIVGAAVAAYFVFSGSGTKRPFAKT